MTSRAAVLDALGSVHDPELDEPITVLRFVTSCGVTPDGDVDIVLRLPTPQCAPNFAYLMAADARHAVLRLPGVREVTVTLEDHYTGAEINAAVAHGEGLAAAFPGETEDDDLGELRRLFQRKALLARQSRLCAALLADGASAEQICASTVAELPDSSDTRRCLELRRELEIPSDAASPAFVLASGERLMAQQFERWLRMGRLVRTSLETNGGLCRSLLRFRHGLAPESEEVAG